jgi:hypothetical protein
VSVKLIWSLRWSVHKACIYICIYIIYAYIYIPCHGLYLPSGIGLCGFSFVKFSQPVGGVGSSENVEQFMGEMIPTHRSL